MRNGSCALRGIPEHTIYFVAKQTWQVIAVVQSGARKHPARRVLDNHVGVHRIPVIHDANHRVFWLVHNWRAELGGCEKPEDRNPTEGILSIGIFITNYGAIETSCNSTWFQPNLPIA